MSREIWLDIFDELRDTAISRGKSEDEADEYARKHVDDRYAETMRDMSDQARTAKKYSM